jgi:glutamate--cysteine ligase
VKFNNESIKPFLKKLARGVERETLRVYNEGSLADSFHPLGLGSKLTHPYITTDYAESLMEFVTSPSDSYEGTNCFLEDLLYMTFHHAPKEWVWPVSMPCKLPADEFIDVADYGDSNVGKMKTIYRLGLGYRYGRSMQTIAGIHYNFSIPKEWINEQHQTQSPNSLLMEFTNNLYFHIIRNFRRHDWIISYLFGATPVVDKSFLVGKSHQLEEITKDTWGLPYATSLRMGGLGYTSKAQEQIDVCFNRISTYIKSIEKARQTSYPEYKKIGVKVDGQYRQLSTGLIQIDNEFYAKIRPKRVRLPGENSLMALQKRGIEYLEVRLLDVNPFEVTGISTSQMKFIDILLLHCLFTESPILKAQECKSIDQFYSQVITQGRDPKLEIHKRASALVNELKITATQLGLEWDNSWEEMASNPSKILSQVMIDSILDSKKSFLDWSFDLADNYRKTILEKGLSSKSIDYYDCLAKDSIGEQTEIEKNDKQNFDDYLSDFYEKTRLSFDD